MALAHWLPMVFKVRVAKSALIANALVFFVFFITYIALNFDAHFTSPGPVTIRGKLYYAIMSHTAVGSNDITPRTDTARMVTASHVTCAWILTFLVFLAAVSA